MKGYFSKYFKVIDINLREFFEINDIKKRALLNSIEKDDVIINCAASLRPKNKSDFYINSDFPYYLTQYIKDKNLNARLIHLSTINTTVEILKDKYSLTKKKSEKLLSNENVIVLRLPLILEKNDDQTILPKGQISIFFKYLELGFLPIYPMVYPGNYFNPIDIKKLSKFIHSIIESGYKSATYNLSGEKKVSSWDLFSEIANIKKKKIIKININFLVKYLPKIIMIFVYKHNFLYNLIGKIDFEKHIKNKKIL